MDICLRWKWSSMRYPYIIGLLKHSILLGLIFLFLVRPSALLAQGRESSDPALRPNLEIIRSEVAGITTEMMGRSNISPEQNVLVNIRNADTSWVVQNALLETLKRMKYNVFLSTSAESGQGASLDVRLVETKVHYGRTFRDSFLGKRKTERTIKIIISGNVRSARDEVMFAGNLSRAFSDTVHVGDLPELENPSIPMTQGEAPEGGFIDNVLEPMIIIGASAVVVYLFFTVRS